MAVVDSTLGAIRTKIRRLTRSPSTSQITDAEIDAYVNTFVLYDFPEHLRLETLRTLFEFYTSPNIDTYDNNTTDATQPLFDFINKFITFHEPLYIGGVEAYYSQSREEFYGIYPLNSSSQSIGSTGNGVLTAFTGTLSAKPVLQNEVLFESIDAANEGLALIDVPVVDATTGLPTSVGNLYVPGTEPATPPTVVLATNTINYVTGVFSITFPTAPASATTIEAQTRPYQAAEPRALLFYQNSFIVRPIPDRVYKISLEAYQRPSELLAAGSSPELEQWWQYIAYGASKKVLEDRSETEEVQRIMPEFKQQERLVLRRTIQQQSNERSPTIYTQQSGLGSSFTNYSGN